MYNAAIKAFALKRPRTANNDPPDHVQQRKNKWELILTKEEISLKRTKPLSKMDYWIMMQLGLFASNIRANTSPLLSLDLHPSLTQDVHWQDNTDWSKLISADAIYKHVRKQKNGKAQDRCCMRQKILKCLIDSPPDIRTVPQTYP